MADGTRTRKRAGEPASIPKRLRAAVRRGKGFKLTAWEAEALDRTMTILNADVTRYRSLWLAVTGALLDEGLAVDNVDGRVKIVPVADVRDSDGVPVVEKMDWPAVGDKRGH